MKKLTALLLAAAAALALLSGCGGTSPQSPASPAPGSSDPAADPSVPPEFATMGELDQDPRVINMETSLYEDKYVYVFTLEDGGDHYYRAVADVPEGVAEEFWSLDFDDPEYDSKVSALLDPLPIVRTEYLNEQILSREELDKLVGMTGQELYDAGWSTPLYCNMDTMEFELGYGPFAYLLVMDGESPGSPEEFDMVEDIKPLKVVSAEFSGLGNAGDL